MRKPAGAGARGSPAARRRLTPASRTFHALGTQQGAGQNLYSAIIRWYDNKRAAPVGIRPPFYAFMLFNQARRGAARRPRGVWPRRGGWRGGAKGP
jgi:hypothetical protein